MASGIWGGDHVVQRQSWTESFRIRAKKEKYAGGTTLRYINEEIQ